jgi:DNA-binding NtrC family response regulator
MKTAEDRLSARRPSVGRGRVLIVDDDPVMCQILCRTLNRHGYQAEGVEDNSQAVARLQGGGFVAAVTDLRLTRMGGRDLLQEIRRVEGFRPAVIYLGTPDPAPAGGRRSDGVFCVLIKGGVRGDLVRAVAEACRVASQARQPRCA